jgi:hypothetical protein
MKNGGLYSFRFILRPSAFVCTYGDGITNRSSRPLERDIRWGQDPCRMLSPLLIIFSTAFSTYSKWQLTTVK